MITDLPKGMVNNKHIISDYSHQFNIFIDNITKDVNINYIFKLLYSNFITKGKSNYYFYKEILHLSKELKQYNTKNSNSKIKKFIDNFELMDILLKLIRHQFYLMFNKEEVDNCLYNILLKYWNIISIVISDLNINIYNFNKYITVIYDILIYCYNYFLNNNILAKPEKEVFGAMFGEEFNELTNEYKDSNYQIININGVETDNKLKEIFDNYNFKQLSNTELLNIYINMIKDNEINYILFIYSIKDNDISKNNLSPVILNSKSKNKLELSPISIFNSPVPIKTKDNISKTDKYGNDREWLINYIEDFHFITLNKKSYAYFSKRIKDIIDDNILSIIKKVEKVQIKRVNTTISKLGLSLDATVITYINKMFITQLEKMILDEMINSGGKNIDFLLLETNLLDIIHCLCLYIVLYVYRIDVDIIELLNIYDIEILEFWKLLLNFVKINSQIIPLSVKNKITKLEHDIIIKYINNSNNNIGLPKIIEIFTAQNNNNNSIVERIFIKKLLKIASEKIITLSADLNKGQEEKEIAWRLFKYSLFNKINIFKNINIDLLIICSLLFSCTKSFNKSCDLNEHINTIWHKYKDLEFSDLSIKDNIFEYYKTIFIPNIHSFISMKKMSIEPNSTPININIKESGRDIIKLINSPLTQNNLVKRDNNIFYLNNFKDNNNNICSFLKTDDSSTRNQSFSFHKNSISPSKTKKSNEFSEENVNKISKIKTQQQSNENSLLDNLIKTTNVILKSDNNSNSRDLSYEERPPTPKFGC